MVGITMACAITTMRGSTSHGSAEGGVARLTCRSGMFVSSIRVQCQEIRSRFRRQFQILIADSIGSRLNIGEKVSLRIKGGWVSVGTANTAGMDVEEGVVFHEPSAKETSDNPLDNISGEGDKVAAAEQFVDALSPSRDCVDGKTVISECSLGESDDRDVRTKDMAKRMM
ncbi:hypothetical protein TSUD_380580 [Trifolium subterraneum]|uniref:Uncharacterized protein n=1 Tax=Trifolium subterraneum TaxID=3900 RepID=A0A2Z6NJ56_TRISU|nr:hypothetical protein TSUD_380580 [Trifolium subterraneum]